MDNQENNRHSAEDLKEFETLIHKKLAIAREELETYKNMMVRKGDGGTSGTTGVYHSLENGAESNQKEEIATLAGRQRKFIISLENALLRIKNGTYGVCFKSGKLISKARLLAVPTTTQSIDEKLKQYK